MDETLSLQVLHPLAHVLAHGQKPRRLQTLPPLPQEVQQAAVLHELGHDEQRLLLQADAVQLHQFRVAKPPGGHDNSNTGSLQRAPSRLFLSSVSPRPHIMTLASSMKSSSYMAPALMALMATRC